MQNKILDRVFTIATHELSSHLEPYKHWTFIVQRNKIVEWGKNMSITPHGSLRGMYLARINHELNPKMHSECVAFKRAKGLLGKMKTFDAINIRLNPRGEMRLSEPCECCYSFLKICGCRKVYFTTNTGWANMYVD